MKVRPAIRQSESKTTPSDPLPAHAISTKFIQFGSKVTIEQEGDEETYTILSPAEAAPHEGRISNESPLARALLNHKAGEMVDVRTPAGVLSVRILSIS